MNRLLLHALVAYFALGLPAFARQGGADRGRVDRMDEQPADFPSLDPAPKENERSTGDLASAAG